jgi:hypothetical protein
MGSFSNAFSRQAGRDTDKIIQVWGKEAHAGQNGQLTNGWMGYEQVEILYQSIKKK